MVRYRQCQEQHNQQQQQPQGTDDVAYSLSYMLPQPQVAEVDHTTTITTATTEEQIKMATTATTTTTTAAAATAAAATTEDIPTKHIVSTGGGERTFLEGASVLNLPFDVINDENIHEIDNQVKETDGNQEQANESMSSLAVSETMPQRNTRIDLEGPVTLQDSAPTTTPAVTDNYQELTCESNLYPKMKATSITAKEEVQGRSNHNKDDDGDDDKTKQEMIDYNIYGPQMVASMIQSKEHADENDNDHLAIMPSTSSTSTSLTPPPPVNSITITLHNPKCVSSLKSKSQLSPAAITSSKDIFDSSLSSLWSSESSSFFSIGNNGSIEEQQQDTAQAENTHHCHYPSTDAIKLHDILEQSDDNIQKQNDNNASRVDIGGKDDVIRDDNVVDDDAYSNNMVNNDNTFDIVVWDLDTIGSGKNNVTKDMLLSNNVDWKTKLLGTPTTAMTQTTNTSALDGLSLLDSDGEEDNNEDDDRSNERQRKNDVSKNRRIMQPMFPPSSPNYSSNRTRSGTLDGSDENILDPFPQLPRRRRQNEFSKVRRSRRSNSPIPKASSWNKTLHKSLVSNKESAHPSIQQPLLIDYRIHECKGSSSSK